jgi:hypothetical protein
MRRKYLGVADESVGGWERRLTLALRKADAVIRHQTLRSTILADFFVMFLLLMFSLLPPGIRA